MINQALVTIHGVNPDRGWQPRVHKVLSPFFSCTAFEYSDYDTLLGPVRAFINIPTFILSLALASYAAWELPEQSFQAGSLFLAAVATFWSALRIAKRARTRCAARLKAAIDEVCPFGSANIIAHSLGTYLIGAALKKFPGFPLDKVILVSSVLPRSYPWSGILTKDPYCVRNVRNEYGKADRVTQVVGWIRWLTPDLGNAGLKGFFEDSKWVHTLNSPLSSCRLCAEGQRARVHNVPIPDFEHSDQFVGDKHARMIWLPYLWGFPPDEFVTHVEACVHAARLKRDKRWHEFEEFTSAIWSAQFTWTEGKTLEQCALDLIVAHKLSHDIVSHVTSLEDVMTKAKTAFPSIVLQAITESSRGAGADPRIAGALHPRTALAHAVERVLLELERRDD